MAIQGCLGPANRIHLGQQEMGAACPLLDADGGLRRPRRETRDSCGQRTGLSSFEGAPLFVVLFFKEFTRIPHCVCSLFFGGSPMLGRCSICSTWGI